MSYKKRQLLGNIALGIAFTLFLSVLLSIPIFCIVDGDINVFEKIFYILLVLYIITTICVMLFLKYIKYEFDEPINETFKSTTKYKIETKEFEPFYNKFHKNIQKQKYYLAKKCQIFENDMIYIYMQPKEDGVLNVVVLMKLEEYNKKKLEVIQNKISEFTVELYGKTMVKDYIKLLRVVCVDKINREFQRFCCEGIECTNYGMTLPVGISFSNKKMYIMETKSSRFDNTIFDSKKYFAKQEEFKNLIFKLIEAERIDENNSN